MPACSTQQYYLASLARLAEYRDGETGTHWKIVHYTECWRALPAIRNSPTTFPNLTSMT
jgi:hypothetical protein